MRAQSTVAPTVQDQSDPRPQCRVDRRRCSAASEDETAERQCFKAGGSRIPYAHVEPDETHTYSLGALLDRSDG